MANPRRDIFNKMAEGWDTKVVLNAGQKETIDKVLKFTKIKASDRVLDLGCGTGVLENYILKYLGGEGALDAMDVSDKMIELAKKKFSDKRISFIAGDIYEHDFGGNNFDKIFVFSCFPHLHDKALALDIFHKILAKKGRVFIFHLEGSEYMNNFHKTKVENEILKKDYLPSGAEMKLLIDKKKWKTKKIKDNKNIYLVAIEKK